MADLQLYPLVIPRDPQTGLSAQLQQQLASSGILGADSSVVEQLTSEPGDQTITGHYRDRYAGKMADELEELAQSSGFEALPLTGLPETTSMDGYYALESATVDPVQPHTTRVQRYDLSLTRKGTKNDYWRAIEPNRRQADHEFGNGTTALVGVPALATKSQWLHPETKARTTASPIETRSAELGDVDIFDLDAGQNAVGTENATLLYEIDYGDEEDVDTRVYDTRGHASKHDADGNLQWQKLFSTQHDFDDEIVLDSGLLRLRLDESSGTIAAEEWDSASSSWTDVGLTQPSGVSLFDVDLLEVAMVRDKAQLTFDVDGSLFALDAILSRGADAVLFDIPQGEDGPIPTEVENWIGAIASTTVVDPNASKGLVGRSEGSR
ncbi:hypothetical protein [Natrialba aegyptia]|uniref:Uncharacterized protein n=1 Tax=Natrialba aegyptia DSM 13077 TaxID=1227491 RepID=M0B539_9EURY|nr:hypothetical protein [Natrialba aegyptia]ELZ05383.1 hypothetical protein C480_10465 [Natrialba aegyptia DSM 13077]